MNQKEYMEQADASLLHVYNRFPVVFERGEGIHLYDTDGKEYLDFAAGIAVAALGYGDAEFTKAVQDQLASLHHTSNLFYTPVMGRAAKALAEAAQMDRVFFTNSGTEAVEGALKAARKAAYTKGSGRTEFIAMEHSFHGRSFGALSVTGTKSYREPFEPLLPGVSFAEFNNIESVRALVTDKTCAVIVEPVQGEGGIHPADPAFLQGLRELCDKEGILLIFDEIQCGMGRTGTMFAWQGYGVKPDILLMAKAIGNGLPVGAFAVTNEVAEVSLSPGDHGTTYGGNPLVCSAVEAVLSIYKERGLVAHAKEMGEYLTEKLDALVEESDAVIERRGVGLIQGLVLKEKVGDVVKRCIAAGLVVISAGENVLRIVPPLIVERQDIEQFLTILRTCL